MARTAGLLLTALMLSVGASAADPRPTNAEALIDAMGKLTSEVSQLRESLKAVKEGSSDPWGLNLPLTPASGSMKFGDGKTRRFVALAGVTEEKPRRRVPTHFYFGDSGNGDEECIVLIDNVKAIRFDAKENPGGKTTVTFWYTDGTSQTHLCRAFAFYMDIKWEDDVAIKRYSLYSASEGLRGAELVISRPKQ